MTQATTATIFDLLPFAPTTEQAQFLYKIEEFMNTDEDFFILRGSAGTGKTSVARAVVDYLGSLQIPCKLSAPTTRAARIISRKTGREARTIHSRIYHIEPMDDGRVKTSLKPAEMSCLRCISSMRPQWSLTASGKMTCLLLPMGF